MLSLRRRAQMGVVSTCLLLGATLSVLYAGSRDGAKSPPPPRSTGQTAAKMSEPKPASLVAAIGHRRE